LNTPGYSLPMNVRLQTTMRAAIVREFGAIETIEVGAFACPEPEAGEVLVSVHAAPVNYVDLLVIGGGYQVRPSLPFVPGKGGAGVVAAYGPGVYGFEIGDRVLAMPEQGGYAEQLCVKARQCYRLPPAMSFAEAAAMSLAYDTAWFALRERGRIRAGETVLVLGASGAVGLATIQLAKAMGARVLAGITHPDRSGTVIASGADETIDLTAPNLRDSLREQVRTANGGALADIVIDPVGGDAFDAALRALAWCGRLVVVGFAAGRIPSLKVNYLLVKNIEVSGLQISDYRKRRPARMAECFRELFDFYRSGTIKPPATTELPLTQAVQALTAIRDRTTAGRRIVLLPQSGADPAAMST
jgi:NADPH2:quinone reductase